MNIIEAVKSGKLFRRKTFGEFLELKEYTHFSHDDILANDWETKQEPREFFVVEFPDGNNFVFLKEDKVIREYRGMIGKLTRVREVINE